MPTIVDDSYSSHDKEKEQCLLLCIVLNLGVSKLPSYRCGNFILCTPCTDFIISCHKDAFAICMELGVLQTIDVALRAGNGIHRPTIVDDSYSSHDKEKEQCLLLCIVFNLGVSKLPSQLL